MISTLSPTDFAILYRFSVALAGVNEEAEHLVHEVLEEKVPRLADLESHQSLVKLLQAIWEAKPEPRGDGPISNLPPQFQWMKTPERAVATLQGIGQFSQEEITFICGATLTEGVMPPEKIASTLASIIVSPELLKRFAVTVEGIHPPFRLLSALGISLLFAALVSLGVATWVWRDWHSKADEILAQKFIHFIEDSDATKLETVNAQVSELSDLLFLKYGLESYPLPKDFAYYAASKIGMTQIDGHAVVQIALKKADARLMLFRAADFGLDSDTNWQTAEVDDWKLAVRSQSQQGQVIIVNGNKTNLRYVLPK